MAGIALPYMGSKRKLASRIVSIIRAENPHARYFYDLFGGGGAVSFEAARWGFDVVYNEIDTGIVSLLEKIRDGGVTREFYQWVDRDTFHANKAGDTWFSGLCSTVWSFGRRGVTYLYGDENAHKKHILHRIIVDGDAGAPALLHQR